MKSLKIIFLISTLLILSACGQNTAGTPEKDVDTKEEAMPHVEDLGIGEIDTTKQSVELSNLIFPTEMTQGDDGNCYYVRKKGKNKIVFYCNDGKEVIETKFKDDLDYIEGFVKYKKYIYIVLSPLVSNDAIACQMASINIETGEWKYLFKQELFGDSQIFFYEDRIYYREADYSDVIYYNLQGKKMGSIHWETEDHGNQRDFNKERHIQMIVDGKIYYTMSTLKREKVKESGGNYLYSCNLDGTEEKKLVEYQRLGPITDKKKFVFSSNQMSMDDKYIYVLERYWQGNSDLYRIPIKGGTIEKVTDRLVYDYKLNDSIIYFIEDYQLYKKNQDLKEETKVFEEPVENVFFAGGYLMLQGYDKEEMDGINDAFDLEIGVSDDYTADYYLVTLDGQLVSKMEGTDVKYTGHHPGEEKWFE
ncbi:MAG: hypothetical protein J1F02_11350 [Lachnospiraceae bacterium]|nr:hypothetical protein [Lachnospiraceae bacterium]